MALLQMGVESVVEVIQRFIRQFESIGGARAEVAGIVAEVDSLLSQAQATEPRVNAALDVLGQDTQATLLSAQAAEWTGASSERFRAATGELVGNIDLTRLTLSDAYGQFRLAAQNLNATLGEVARQFDLKASEAELATSEARGVLEGHVAETETLFATGIR